MDTLTRNIDAHLAGYCEPDATRRADLLAGAWVADGVLIDPPMDGAGVEAIAGLTDVVLQHYPGHRFQRTTAVDAHHDVARYGWSLVAPDGTTAVTGIDVVEVDGDQKLKRIIGFFGDMTPKD